MGTVQYRVELNPLTKPASYRLRFMPHQIAGYKELAAAVANEIGLSTEQANAVLHSAVKQILQMLCNGIQVTLEDGITFSLSFHARLDSPDDQLPPIEELVRIVISATRPAVHFVQQNITLERLPAEEKAPVMLSADDTKLKLADVLFAGGVLRLTGSHLDFDEENPACGCVIAGTRNGEQQQSVYGMVSNSQVLVVPNIPVQDAPWNNEYTVSLSTQYSEHGSLRSGTYSRRLRAPIVWDGLPHEGGTGILTGSAEVPYVTIESGTIAADEMVRIQAVYDVPTSMLMFNLLSMKENGSQGVALAVPANGNYIVQGFTGSGVSEVHLTVHEHSALVDLVRNNYAGRLVDIIDIRRT
jgi:hypothetical protein